MTLTQEQKETVKKELDYFNNWQGKAKIMFDLSDNECWTDVFSSDNDDKVYHSSSIICVYQKGNFVGRNDKISLDILLDILTKLK